jgi:hypothetical protein
MRQGTDGISEEMACSQGAGRGEGHRSDVPHPYANMLLTCRLFALNNPVLR